MIYSFIKYIFFNRYTYNLAIFASIVVFMFIFRSNSLLYDLPLNPDEAERIANAVRIFSYGYTWSYVDGYSSGPLNSIVLLWPKIFYMEITYFTARLTSIFLLSSIVFITFKIFEISGKRIFAFIATIPILSFYSFTTSSEFLHYSSEQVSTFLIVLSFYLVYSLNNNISQKARYIIILFLALFLSTIPFAKLQATPLSLAIWLSTLYIIYKSDKSNNLLYELSLFVLSSSLVPILFLFPLLINNELNHFYNSYILWAMNYVSQPLSFNSFIELLRHDVGNNVFKIFIISSFFLFSLILLFSNYFREKKLNKISIILIIVVMLSYYIIIKPGRPFPHYIHFFIPFMIIFLGFTFGTLIQLLNSMALRNLITISLLFLFSYQSYAMYKILDGRHVIDEVKKIYISLEYLLYGRNLFDFLLFPKSETISVLAYGWMSDYYVNKDIIPASREGMNQNQIEDSILKGYFQDRLISDINLSQPEVIIDAVYEGAFGFSDNKAYGIGSFIELENVVNKKYTLLSADKTFGKPSIYISNIYLERLDKYLIRINNIIASGYYDDSVLPQNVNDYSVFEKSSYGKTIFDYWMLPDNTLGDIKFYFNKPEELNLIKILNTTNGHYSEKSTNEVQIKIWHNDKLVYTITKVLNKYPLWTDVVLENSVYATSVTIEILSFNGAGAGLNEVKFYKISGGIN